MAMTVEKLAYDLVEIQYIDMMKVKDEYQSLEEFDLWNEIFPMDWHQIVDYKTKVEFLNKAITTNTNLKDVEGIYTLIEGDKLKRPFSLFL